MGEFFLIYDNLDIIFIYVINVFNKKDFRLTTPPELPRLSTTHILSTTGDDYVNLSRYDFGKSVLNYSCRGSYDTPISNCSKKSQVSVQLFTSPPVAISGLNEFLEITKYVFCIYLLLNVWNIAIIYEIFKFCCFRQESFDTDYISLHNSPNFQNTDTQNSNALLKSTNDLNLLILDNEDHCAEDVIKLNKGWECLSINPTFSNKVDEHNNHVSRLY